MRLKFDQLAQQLQKTLSPIYLLSGDEPLLIQELRDMILAACNKRGFTGREIHRVENNFNWPEFIASAQTISMFDDKSLIELRLNEHKLGKPGSQALQQYCGNIPQDKILLLTMTKLDRMQQNGAWFSNIDKTGVIVQLWPLTSSQLISWVKVRLQQQGLEATIDAINLLIDHTQSNLLALQQEIIKLGLQFKQHKLTLDDIKEIITEQSRFIVFDLIDTLLQGNQQKIIKIMQYLTQNDTPQTLVLWALTTTTQQLLSLAKVPTTNMETQMNKLGIWATRKPLFKQAVAAFTLANLQQMLQHALRIELIIKGIKSGNAWHELLQLALQFAHIKLFCGYFNE